MVQGRPQYYNHQLNLYKWIYNPGEWAFTARGVYAREKMFPGCKVLDLCCGDGSYSYLFFSDIAGAIDAVDIDQTAIKHALRYYASRPNIKYHRLDITRDNFPSSGYDFVIWNAAICYFDITDIHTILQKIVHVGNSSLSLWYDADGTAADHKPIQDISSCRNS
jgi:SAM-dependent methyltransferase